MAVLGAGETRGIVGGCGQASNNSAQGVQLAARARWGPKGTAVVSVGSCGTWRSNVSSKTACMTLAHRHCRPEELAGAHNCMVSKCLMRRSIVRSTICACACGAAQHHQQLAALTARTHEALPHPIAKPALQARPLSTA